MTDVAAVVRELVVFLLIALIVILVVRRLAIPYTLGLVVAGLLISNLGLVSGGAPDAGPGVIRVSTGAPFRGFLVG